MKVENIKITKKTNQIILVIGNRLEFYSKENNRWTKKMEVKCIYGKNGFSINRHSGDLTTPIGAFPILYAFGTKKNVNTKIEYKLITENSYFSDDEEKYDEYNTWIESKNKINGEHLIDYPKEYEYGFVIGFNVNPKIKGKGSSFFLHCIGKNNYTAGCIAIDTQNMIYLLRKINTGAHIVIASCEDDFQKYNI